MELTTYKGLQVITPDWDVPNHVIAYTTTRLGGYSHGNYASLNLGLHVGDDKKLVDKNRSLLPESHNLCWLEQVHGNEIKEAQKQAPPPRADGLYSDTQDVYCAIMTADCVPVLLCNHNGTEVAAVHAGWKGLQLGIIAKALDKMRAENSQIKAWIGPCISQVNYEVGLEVAKHFVHQYPQACHKTHSQKYLLNLPGIATKQLAECGVSDIFASDACTYQHADTFFSHRFATHQNLSSTGRIASVIGLSSPLNS